ncbi:PREDICTED: uncharacterized protein LOC106147485 isoform X3 [Chinchilla lanigera]|uniref:uncharacterized protein LOC106147485 isoform X3 n=1 Tax=Chinchilla lanigera TaxID=34839 RepID=UPI000696221C|nr:PREDICTED: uncharacterized protein LOC106147485 isoform X3 [Chinchilla lanigera]
MQRGFREKAGQPTLRGCGVVLMWLPCDSISVSLFPGLLSLQVLNDEMSDCKEERPVPATTPGRPVQRRNSWNLLKCTYMVFTFLFVSYNKGDWCYCHYCNPDQDIRNDPCCSY